MKTKLTKSTVDGADPTGRRYTIWDAEQTGFGLRVGRDGAKSFVVKYLTTDGRQKWFTLGTYGDLTPKEARDEAARVRSAAARGEDPQSEKLKSRKAETVAELCDKYLKEGCATKKASTLATDRGRIKRHIKPLLGGRRVKDITHNDIKRFMIAVAEGKTSVDERTGPRGRARVSGGKGTASRTVGLLGGIFAFAVAEDMRPDNPVHGVKRYPDRRGERFLSPQELARLGDALSKAERNGTSPIAINVLRALILTGCRKSEILELLWNEVDFEQGYLRLTDSKTREKAVPLGASALELFASIPRMSGNPYVFPGMGEGIHLVGLPKIWERIRKMADLDDVRLHDLRHSFASVGAGAGIGLTIVGKLLGHRDPKTTARYSHVANDPARTAADLISSEISEAMKPQITSAAVVEIPVKKEGNVSKKTPEDERDA